MQRGPPQQSVHSRERRKMFDTAGSNDVSYRCQKFQNMDIDIGDLFAAATPACWHQALVMRACDRARCFVIPLEEDIDKLVHAKNLVAEVITGCTMNAGVRWKYSGSDWAKVLRISYP